MSARKSKQKVEQLIEKMRKRTRMKENQNVNFV